MKNIFIILLLFFLSACSGKELNKTNQKKILSNTKLSYDMKLKSFKMDFSINNYTKETLNNFVYQIIFKNDKGVVITTVEEFYKGAIEPKKAKRATIFVDDYTRKNFKSFEIEIKK